MQTLKEKDKHFIWHPYTSLLAAPDPILIVKGEGLYLIDEKEKRYIDAISSWWVTLHGHAHPYIAERIYRQALQLEQVIFAGFTHPPAIELAERLINVLPGSFSKIFYSDNGSTATEVAVKMALQFWWNNAGGENSTKRNKILAFRNSYHGDTFGAMSVSERSVFTLAFREKLFDVVFIDTPETENLEVLKSRISGCGDEIAAFIYEPLVQGAGGMKMHEPTLLNELLHTCQQHEIICIADEVMTGFGRTGVLFASEQMEIKPDIICLSKGLTGGTMALGVTACTNKIVAAFRSEDKLKTFFHGHSFTANPIACTAALASLELLQSKACTESIEKISASHFKFAKQLQHHPAVKNARCCGTILAFEYNAGDDHYLNDISRSVTAHMLQKGIFIRPLGNTVYIMPPYCISAAEIQKVYSEIIHFIDG
ncbi:MAG: adenosylmethionine--8-amino-7-oxononanoate transaminase [Chitinophagaceae bacterium]